MSGTDTTQDVRELLGLRSLPATFLVAVFVVTFAVVAWATLPNGGILAQLTAWLAISIGAVAIIRAPGDPISMPWTIYLTLVGPAAASFVLAVVPVPIDALLQLWPLPAATAIYTYMCVRGRTAWAWLGMTLMIGVCMAWAHKTGQGAAHGFSISAINLAPVAMSTFFALTIRPAARAIFALRAKTIERVAAEAADRASLDERDRQLARLDALARPLLQRLTDSRPLNSQEHQACALLESHLRDSIRAPALTMPQIADAARSARLRGAEVIMLDDHGPGALSHQPVRNRVLDAIVGALEDVETGTLTIRILPPNRPALVTIVHSSPEAIRRVEYDQDGHPAVRR